MTDWEMKVHNFMCLNKFVKKGEIVFTGSSLCELFPINEMLQNVEPRICVYNRGIGGDVTDTAAQGKIRGFKMPEATTAPTAPSLPTETAATTPETTQ